MGSTVFPAASAGGGIKSVQRGSAGGAGNVTITSVDLSKSFVNIFGTASSGTVAGSGAIAATTHSSNGSSGNIAGHDTEMRNRLSGNGQNSFIQGTGTSTDQIWATGRVPAHSFTGGATSGNIAATNISGGSNNLVAAVVQGFLATSTTLTVSGACRWEVVEFA